MNILIIYNKNFSVSQCSFLITVNKRIVSKTKNIEVRTNPTILNFYAESLLTLGKNAKLHKIPTIDPPRCPV